MKSPTVVSARLWLARQRRPLLADAVVPSRYPSHFQRSARKHIREHDVPGGPDIASGHSLFISLPATLRRMPGEEVDDGDRRIAVRPPTKLPDNILPEFQCRQWYPFGIAYRQISKRRIA